MKYRAYILGFLISSLLTTNAVFAQDAAVTVSLGVRPGFQFDLVRFSVKPNTPVKIVFANTGSVGHNLVIIKPGSRERVAKAIAALGNKAKGMHYIPASSDVLCAISLVPPNQTRSLSFIAPLEEGVYQYICTFPGRMNTMYGAMYVTRDSVLPDIRFDQHLPPHGRSEDRGAAVDDPLKISRERERVFSVAYAFPDFISAITNRDE